MKKELLRSIIQRACKRAISEYRISNKDPKEISIEVSKDFSSDKDFIFLLEEYNKEV